MKMKKKLFSKILALILVLSMSANMIGVQALATETDDANSVTVIVESVPAVEKNTSEPASAAVKAAPEPAPAAPTVTETTTTNPDNTTTTTTTTITTTAGENGSTTVVEKTDHTTTGTNTEGAQVNGSGSSTSTTVTNAEGAVIESSSSEESTTTTTLTTTDSDGTTVVVETTQENRESGNSEGDSQEFEEITTTVTEQDGNTVTESWVQDGTEKTVEVTQPENVTLPVPTVTEDDPTTTTVKENESTATFGDPAGTEKVPDDLPNDPPEGEDDPEYDYAREETLQQGSVTVTTTDITITETPSDETDLDYTYSSKVGTPENDLLDTGPVPEAPNPEELDVQDGYSHLHWDGGYLSRFCAALVCTEGYEGEEPVFYDENGVPYYVQADHNIFENRKLYVDDYYINGEHVEEKTYARWDHIQQFILVDAKTGELITTYCADQKTHVQDGYSYTMENVEDADYYDQDQAEMIRSVALNGYWGTEAGFGSLSRMKENLTASGEFTEAEIAALTDGIAMTATQYAIWTFSNVSNGDKYISSYYVNDKLNPGRVPEEEKSSVELIFKLYHYLIDLEPTPVENTTADTIINADNFVKDLEITVVEKARDHANNRDADDTNDAYVTNLTFALVVTPSEENGDDLVVSVVAEDGKVLASGRIAGELKEGENLLLPDGDGNYSFTGITLTEGEQNFNITLEGIQNLTEGVYLYSSEVRDEVSSQTLVGVASGKRGVDVSMNIKFDLSVEDEIVVTERVWHNEGSDTHEVPPEPPKDDPDPPEEKPKEPEKEKPKEPEKEIPAAPAPIPAPKTGDNFPMVLAVMILSGSCLMALALTRRTEQMLLPALAETAEVPAAAPRRRFGRRVFGKCRKEVVPPWKEDTGGSASPPSIQRE